MARVFFTAMHDLECLTVKMKRMSSGVIVVENQFNNLAVFEYEGICVSSIDSGISCIFTCGENGI
jgi:hypothetical protein